MRLPRKRRQKRSEPQEQNSLLPVREPEKANNQRLPRLRPLEVSKEREKHLTQKSNIDQETNFGYFAPLIAATEMEK